jgi:spore coat polysaccharide biosynthesis predicted glycosyltransferase SpsG
LIKKNIHGRLLLVRADGGSSIGFGHIMRSMAIAEEWLLRGGRCLWLTTSPEALKAAGSSRDVESVLLAAPSGGQEDAAATRRLAEANDTAWVLADLFTYSPAYFASAGARKAKWMILADEPVTIGERIDAVLSPGPQASPDFYPGRSGKCELLLGLDYTLLRGELRMRPQVGRERPDRPGRILITFGGSDPLDVAWRTLVEISRQVPSPHVRWRVILGPGYRGRCPGDAQAFGDLQVEFVRYTSDMGHHYNWADLILCGASTTLWEAFFFGAPAVVIPAAGNQGRVFEALRQYPAAKCFAAPDAAFSDWLRGAIDGAEAGWMSMASASGPQLVDGQGVSRTVDFLSA